MYNKNKLQLSLAGLFCMYLGMTPVFGQEKSLQINEGSIQNSNAKAAYLIENFSTLALNQKTELFSNEQVSISYAKEIYKNDSAAVNQERINFYFENKSNQTVTIEFQKIVKYLNRSITSDVKVTSITLAPNQTLSNNDARFDARFYAFIKDLRGSMKAELEKVELKNIIVR